jgi:hypothetical protein
MSDIEAKALALVNEIELERGSTPYSKLNRHGGAEAIYRAIEAHEAFRQEVSDVMTYIKALYPTLPRNFNRFIIPKSKPDPLLDIVEWLGGPVWGTREEYVREIRAALDARGWEIKEKAHE